MRWSWQAANPLGELRISLDKLFVLDVGGLRRGGTQIFRVPRCVPTSHYCFCMLTWEVQAKPLAKSSLGPFPLLILIVIQLQLEIPEAGSRHL